MVRKSTDFSKILTELQGLGVNDYEMSKLTGIERTGLSRLRKGTKKQANYDDGVAIMEIYKTTVTEEPSKNNAASRGKTS